MKKTKKTVVISYRVQHTSVIFRLRDGTLVERDFNLCRGGVFARLHRANGLDPRVRIDGSRLVWPGDIDFELANVIWGWPRRWKNPPRRALIGGGGRLIPDPIVREID